MKSIVLGLLSLLLITSSQAQNYGLSLNGSSQFVNVPDNALINPNSFRTMECWVRFNSLTAPQEIISKSANSAGAEMLVFGTNLAVYLMNTGTNTSYITYPMSNFVINTWYHLAFTWNGTKETMTLYVNGIAVSTSPTHVGNINSSGLANPSSGLRIGMWSDVEARYLNGRVDEVRIWSTTRTAAQIKQGMYGVPTNSTGLIAYYKLNENAGSTATNLSTNGATLNGTLVASPAYVTTPTAYSPNGLEFDGVDDYAWAPGRASWDITTGTIECLVKPTSFTASVNHCILGLRSVAGTRFSIHITGSTLGWFNGTYFTQPYTFTPGTWYHLAFVVTGTTTTAYVNGVLLGTYAANSGMGGATSPTLVLGSARDATEIERYIGAIDEVRIWSTQRTPTEIAQNRNVTLTGTETGLLAHYSFDLGNPGGTNTGLVTVPDNTTTNGHLNLVNFALGTTGNVSNYVGSPIFILPVTYTGFTAVKQNGQALLQWQTSAETNSSHFIVERSSDGVKYDALGRIESAGTTSLTNKYSFTDRNPINGTNYYRLKQVDISGAFEYSAIKTLDFTSAARLQWFSTGAGSVEVRFDKGTNETYQLVDVKGSILQTGYLKGGRVQFTGLRAGTYVIKVKELTKQFLVK